MIEKGSRWEFRLSKECPLYSPREDEPDGMTNCSHRTSNDGLLLKVLRLVDDNGSGHNIEVSWLEGPWAGWCFLVAETELRARTR